MIDKYNAFISYRHADLDSKIAAHVQKSLERFHIPDKIKKTTGKKRIERIFRDKDELPITSDLTETISGALENSDYLIVICSENTKESFWVKREIEYFLRSHSRDRVLTVLAGGDPQEVIPEALLTQEKTFTDENGIEHTVKAPLEPLSCDYRLPMRKADKEELPRLASAIIGCSYDELMNRRRAYRIRRAALLAGLVFSLLLAFGMYWLDTSRKIEQSLQDAMRSRSLYLANESIRLSGERDRVAAAQLALESVPEDFPVNRLTPQSVRALNQATLAYTTDNGICIEPEWNFYMFGTVWDFCVSDDGDHLAAYDNLGNFRVWNVKEHEVVLDIATTGQDIREIMFANDDIVIVSHSLYFVAYDIGEQEEIWRSDDMSMTYSGALQKVDEDHFIAVGASGKVLLVDNSTGNVAKTWMLPLDGLALSDLVYDPNGNDIGIVFSDYNDYSNITYTPAVYDLDTEQLICGQENDSPITEIKWLSNGNLVFGSYLDYNTVLYDRGTVSCESTVTVTACNREDLSVLWENTITYTSSATRLGILEVAGSGNLACDLGSKCELINIDTGESIRSIETDDYIVYTWDTGSGEFPTFITRGGDVIIPFWYDGSFFSTVSYDCLNEDIMMAAVKGAVFTLQYNSDHITCFYSGNVDESLDPTCSLGSGYDIGGGVSSDEVTALIYCDPILSFYGLLLIDPSTNDILDDIELNSEDYYGFTLVGARDNIVYLYAHGVGKQDLLIIDSEDSDIETVDLGTVNLSTPSLIHDGKLCVYSCSNDQYYISIYDTASDDLEAVELPGSGYHSTEGCPLYLADVDKIVCSYDLSTWLVDPDTGDVVEIDTPEGWGSVVSAVYVPDSGTIIMTDSCSVVCVDEDGDVVEDIEISTDQRQLVDISVVTIGEQDRVMFLYGDGCLYEYSSDLTLVGMSVLSTTLRYDPYHPTAVRYFYNEDEQLLFVEGTGFVSVIAIDEYYETTFIDNCYAYCEGSDRFFVSYEDDDDITTAVGCFDRYSDEELVARAQEYLDGAELSDAMRARYGI